MLTAAILLAATTSAFDQVVATERAFAAASLQKGFHESFLEYLAPDAIEFHPAPQPARPSHENQPHAMGTLAWGPAWVFVSSAGDLALSSGPFEIRTASPTMRGVTPGLFLSVWRLQPDGTWKGAVDSGISSPIQFAIPKSVENGSGTLSPAAKPRPSDGANARLAITTAERALTAAAKSGLGDAIAGQADPRVRVYREGEPAGIGKEGARGLLQADKRKVACKPDQITASASGDLGYAYGTCSGDKDGKPHGYGFLHVWRKQPDGTWRILVDVSP